jgi:hypothetical protein
MSYVPVGFLPWLTGPSPLAPTATSTTLTVPSVKVGDGGLQRTPAPAAPASSEPGFWERLAKGTLQYALAPGPGGGQMPQYQPPAPSALAGPLLPVAFAAVGLVVLAAVMRSGKRG